MADTAAVAPTPRRRPAAPIVGGRVLPVAAVGLAILVLWYIGAVWLNAPQVIDRLSGGDTPWTTADLIAGTFSMQRPVLPTPDQVAVELWKSTAEQPPTSKRSLLLHAWVTAVPTLIGFLLGALLGIALAVGIVHVATLDRSLMPWVIASQTIPILAIAPMIIVVLGNIGITGLIPKSLISMYLCFFPVTIGMVKGLRSPEPLQLDLMRTYNASQAQLFAKLRWPSAMPFLFASLKVAVAISLVGAIVGELPTGATAGLGARLLSGSYYGQTVQIWSALVVAALLGTLLVAAVGAVEALTLRRMGTPPEPRS
ncbi:MAG: ABC transporter permease [Dongiaceae bacterium]